MFTVRFAWFGVCGFLLEVFAWLVICLLLCWIGCLLELVELISCLFWFVCCFTVCGVCLIFV